MVWYRHSGEEEIDEIPWNCTYERVENEGEITRDIGDNYITHMSIRYNILPTLTTIAPQLTHLQICWLPDNTQLQR